MVPQLDQAQVVIPLDKQLVPPCSMRWTEIEFRSVWSAFVVCGLLTWLTGTGVMASGVPLHDWI